MQLKCGNKVRQVRKPQNYAKYGEIRCVRFVRARDKVRLPFLRGFWASDGMNDNE